VEACVKMDEPPAVSPDHRPWPWWPPAAKPAAVALASSGASYRREVDAQALDL